jgi:hypothetical protein
MADERQRIERLLALREEVLTEMAEADLEFSRVRMALERMESDMRLGRPEAPNYTQVKGREFPRAESRVLDLFRDLLKLEDKINISSASSRS